MTAVIVRRYILDTAGLFRWLRTAKAGDEKIYHVGFLAADKEKEAELFDLAEAVRIMVDTEYLAIHQYRQSFPIDNMSVYVTRRTGTGYAPSGLTSGTLSPRNFSALNAILHRDADISAARAVRDVFSISDVEAKEILADLRARDLIYDGPAKGLAISKTALGLMM